LCFEKRIAASQGLSKARFANLIHFGRPRQKITSGPANKRWRG
jgi:hypothetical protein